MFVIILSLLKICGNNNKIHIFNVDEFRIGNLMRRWRHLLVAILVVPVLTGYIILATTFSEFIVGRSLFVDFIFYLLAGLIWIPGAAVVIRWLADKEAK